MANISRFLLIWILLSGSTEEHRARGGKQTRSDHTCAWKQHHPMSPLYGRGNRRPERLGDVQKVTQPPGSGGGETQGSRFHTCCFFLRSLRLLFAMMPKHHFKESEIQSPDYQSVPGLHSVVWAKRMWQFLFSFPFSEQDPERER